MPSQGDETGLTTHGSFREPSSTVPKVAHDERYNISIFWEKICSRFKDFSLLSGIDDGLESFIKLYDDRFRPHRVLQSIEVLVHERPSIPEQGKTNDKKNAKICQKNWRKIPREEHTADQSSPIVPDEKYFRQNGCTLFLREFLKIKNDFLGGQRSGLHARLVSSCQFEQTVTPMSLCAAFRYVGLASASIVRTKSAATRGK